MRKQAGLGRALLRGQLELRIFNHIARPLFLIGLLLLYSCTTELYTGLDQRQANEIVAVLMRNGISAERYASQDGKMVVRVEEKRFGDAMAILSTEGLPRQEFSNLGEVFKRDGLVSSPIEERAAMIYGLSQELSRTISEIDGVVSARVHLVLPENDPLRQNLIPSSASVFIRHRQQTDIGELIPQVKMLVAKGIAGLSYDNVSVVLVAARPDQYSANSEATPNISYFNPAAWSQEFLLGLAILIAALVGGVAVWVSVARRGRIYKLDSTPQSASDK